MTEKIIHIFRTTRDYISHIQEMEEDRHTVLSATSFLPSHLFSKDAIYRYFLHDLGRSPEARGVAAQLWSRRRSIHAAKNPRYEIYEMDSLDALCSHGIVHRQAPDFRVTPNELISVLETLTRLCDGHDNFNIAFCAEALPFDFYVTSGGSLTIDVRNNYGYQNIQGLLFHSSEIVDEFEKEFWRIWNDSRTISDRKAVMDIMRSKMELANRT